MKSSGLRNQKTKQRWLHTSWLSGGRAITKYSSIVCSFPSVSHKTEGREELRIQSPLYSKLPLGSPLPTRSTEWSLPLHHTFHGGALLVTRWVSSAGKHIFAFAVTKGQFDSARYFFLLLFKAEVEKK